MPTMLSHATGMSDEFQFDWMTLWSHLQLKVSNLVTSTIRSRPTRDLPDELQRSSDLGELGHCAVDLFVGVSGG